MHTDQLFTKILSFNSNCPCILTMRKVVENVFPIKSSFCNGFLSFSQYSLTRHKNCVYRAGALVEWPDIDIYLSINIFKVITELT